MKTAIRSLFIAILITAGAAEYAAAQPGQGPGFRGGGMFGDPGETISDALVLKADRAAKITEVFEGQREAMRERFTSGDRPDFQSMSQDERMEFFNKMRAEAEADTVKRLSIVLSNDEIEFVKPLIGMRGARPDAQIRALRMIDISDETRGKLQTLALIYFNTVAAVQPEFTPGQPPQGGRGQGRGPRGGISEEDRKTIETARESMIADATQTLTDDEVKAWKKKAAEVEKEMESQRQQRGQGRQGGGQGRGQGQGGQDRG